MSLTARGAAAAVLFVQTFAIPISVAHSQITSVPDMMWAAQTGARSIRLAWNHMAGAATYTISCEIGDRPPRVFGSISLGTAVKDASGLPLRASYVIAVNANGAAHRCYLQWSSDAKSALSERIPFNVVTAVNSGPTKVAPASVSGKASGAGEITLTWSEVPGATAYTIGRAVWPNGFKTLCDVCPTTTALVDRSAQAGKKHTYTVTPITAAGESLRGTSNIVVAVGTNDEVITGADPSVDGAVKAPSGVTATVNGAASVTVSWSAVDRATGYEVYRSVNGGALQLVGRARNANPGSKVEVPDYLGSFLVTGVTRISARYAVKSIDSNGFATVAENSNEVVIDSKSTVAPGAGSTNASNTRATATSANSVTLTWSPPPGGVSCALRRSLGGGSYAAIPVIAAGTWQYVDTAPGLLYQRPRYEIVCGLGKLALPPVAFPVPLWDSATSPIGGVASTTGVIPTKTGVIPTNLRALATSADTVTLTWTPPTSAIACTVQRSLGVSPYLTLEVRPVGAFQYVDIATGLLAQRPRYQLLCGGDPKSGPTPARFPDPTR